MSLDLFLIRSTCQLDVNAKKAKKKKKIGHLCRGSEHHIQPKKQNPAKIKNL